MIQALFETKCETGQEFKDMFPALTKCIFNICTKNVCGEANSATQERLWRSQFSYPKNKNEKKTAFFQTTECIEGKCVSCRHKHPVNITNALNNAFCDEMGVPRKFFINLDTHCFLKF